MLVKRTDSEDHEIVMGIIVDLDTRQLKFVYSVYGNHRAQYPHDAIGHEVIDSTIPDFWQLDYNAKTKEFTFAFPEWVNNPGKKGKPGFYEKYVEDEPKEVEIFKKYFLQQKEYYSNDPHLTEDSQT